MLVISPFERFKIRLADYPFSIIFRCFSSAKSGLPTPINDLLIMDPENLKQVPTGTAGEVWIRGANVMQEYWKDPEATRRVITDDGWFRYV